MALCQTCGNEYDKSLQVILGGEKHPSTVSSAQSSRLAPACAHCQCRIVGQWCRSKRNHVLLRSLRRGSTRLACLLVALKRRPDQIRAAASNLLCWNFM
jgi:hypothetical protein